MLRSNLGLDTEWSEFVVFDSLSLSGAAILTYYSNTLSFLSSRRVNDQVSYPYNQCRYSTHSCYTATSFHVLLISPFTRFKWSVAVRWAVRYGVKTNNCTLVYIWKHVINIVCRLHVSAVDVTIIREVHYKGLLHRNIKELSEAMQRLKIKREKCSRYRLCVAQRTGRGIAPLFHDGGTRRGWVVSSTLRPHFTPGKDPVPILQEVGWDPGPVWTGGKSRPHRDSIPDRPARSLVAIRTEPPGPQLRIIQKQKHNIYLFLFPRNCTWASNNTPYQFFPNFFCSRTPIGFETWPGSSHPCSCKYSVSGW